MPVRGGWKKATINFRIKQGFWRRNVRYATLVISSARRRSSKKCEVRTHEWVQKKDKDRELPESIFFATFLACPKKGGPKEGHPAPILFRQARSSSGHFGNLPFGLRTSKMLFPWTRSPDGNVRMGLLEGQRHKGSFASLTFPRPLHPVSRAAHKHALDRACSTTGHACACAA
jgi:hypothetical protein